MKTLIWQQIHLRTPGQAALWRVSQELVRRLNPEADLLVIDNASPVAVDPWLPGDWVHCQLRPMSELVPELTVGSHTATGKAAMVHFHESLGHFFHGHSWGLPVRDGPGRAHTLALQMALEAGYDRACYVEADCLFRRPVGALMDGMTKPVGCQARIKYGYLDWHVWPIADLAWLREFDFIGRYNWRRRVGEPGGELPGEHVYEQIFGDNLEVLPISVIRGDVHALTAENLHSLFPAGLDGLTHVSLDCFALWLEDNGHADLATQLTG